MYFVYILTNWSDSVLYIGVTSNLQKRLYEHQNHLVDGFSSKYNTHKLVYFETTNDVYSAISREKQLKNGAELRKINLSRKSTPNGQICRSNGINRWSQKIPRRASLARDDKLFRSIVQ